MKIHAVYGVALAATGLFLLSACGGGGEGSPATTSMTVPVPVVPTTPPAEDEDTTPPVAVLPPASERPRFAGWSEIHAPIVDLDTLEDKYWRTLSGLRHVGANVAPSATLPRSGMHDGVSIFYGTLRDGVGRAQVLAWLQENVDRALEWGPGFDGLPIHPNPPVIRLVEGTSAENTDIAIRAVQAVNSVLPSAHKLRFGTPIALPNTPDSRDGVGNGEILIHMAPREEWPQEAKQGTPTSSAGTYVPIVAFDERQRMFLRAGIIALDPMHIDQALRDEQYPSRTLDQQQNRIGYVVHEIVHTLGFLAHPESLPTILTYNLDLKRFGGNPGHYLYPLDLEGIHAAYSRLEPHARSADLRSFGPWSSTSTHIRGVLDDVTFGAAARNSIEHGYAFGQAPDMDLAANSALSGTASWAGRLLGLTPQLEVVGGSASLVVELETLTGAMNFADLESWSANAVLGAIGTGSMWGDGDLGYTIAVHGNAFRETAGDDGTLTGAFFGRSHEGMGGTLERDDLSAGFGGTR